MKKYKKRLISLILSVVLALNPAMASWADENGSKYQKEYVEGLTGRYEKYLEDEYSYEGLLHHSDFIYCSWADDVYYKTHGVSLDHYVDEGGILDHVLSRVKALGHNTMAAGNSAVQWAATYLVDTKLDQEAYEKYLSMILAMHEKGFLETAMRQAEYDATVGVDDAMKVGWLSLKTANKISKIDLSKILGTELCKELETSLKGLGLGMDGLKLTLKPAVNEAEALSVIMYTNLHKERLELLNAICEHADPKEDKKLIKAAKNMIDVTNLRFFALYSALAKPEDYKDAMDFFGTLVLGKDLDDFADMLGAFVTKHADILAEKLIKNGAIAKKVGESVKFLGSNVSLVMAGLEIGGMIGKLKYGDQYERSREILAMNRIGLALSSGLSDAAEDCLAKVPDDTRYQNIYRMVAIGEALCYVHNRGEYVFLEFEKGLREQMEADVQSLEETLRYGDNLSVDYAYAKAVLPERKAELETMPSLEELTKLYDFRAGDINGYYRALASIFAVEPAQIAVCTWKEDQYETAGQNRMKVTWHRPQVYISTNEDAADKINRSEAFQEYYNYVDQDIKNARDSLISFGTKMNTNGYDYALHVDQRMAEAYASGNGLSLRMYDLVSQSFSAHAMKYVYTMNFDTTTGESLTLDDILDTDHHPSAKQELKAKLVKALDQEMGGYHFTGDSFETMIEKYAFGGGSDEHHWYFSKDGFSIIFDLYTVAPYAGGTPVISVPYSELSGILKEEYLPEDRSSMVHDGRLIMMDKDTLEEDFTGNYSAKAYGDYDNSNYGIVPDGTVLDASLEYQYEGVLFYANYMMENNVAWLADKEREHVVVEATYTTLKQNMLTEETVTETHEAFNQQ